MARMLEMSVPADPVDPDPLPRPAPVGPGSAFRAVADAAPVTIRSVEIVDAPVLPAPRRRPLRSWRFDAGDAARRVDVDAVLTGGHVVAVPHCWSRSHPELHDHPGPALYAREVTANGPHARLVGYGLDYVSRIIVDGETAAVHEGAFAPAAVELPVGRPVPVAVWLDDPVEEHRLTREPGLKKTRKIKGTQEDHDSRPGGMAYGPLYDHETVRMWPTGGITEKVVLHETGPLRVAATFATAEPGSLRLSWVIENLGPPVQAEIMATIGGAAVRVQVELEPGPGRASVRLDTGGESPWSPDDPALYELRTALFVDGVLSDADRTTVGFRSVDMATEGPGQLILHLNGSRTYVRAANYIPGMWWPELTATRVQRDVDLALAANLNSFGVHATVCPQLYPEADRRGLLVYQDFPLQQAYDATGGPLIEGGADFADASLHLTAELVYRFYNHPSIVYWCGHNEPAYMFAPPEGLEDTLPAESVFREMLRHLRELPDEEALDVRRVELFRSVDPTRPALQASGMGGKRPDGDVHDYAGSLSGGHATASTAGRTAFVSEFGAWAANFSAAAEVGAARGDWPPPPEADRDWHMHTHLVWIQNTFAGRPDRFEDFQRWCFAGQLWAGWHAKTVIEKARAAKYRPSAAHRWHFYVDHFGAAGAGVVDRHRTTGPAYRGLAATNRPLLPLSPLVDGGRITPGSQVHLPLIVVNDLARDLGTVPLRWRLAALGDEDRFLVGRDDWTGLTDDPLLHPAAPDHCAVLPRRAGRTLLEGEIEITVGPDDLVAAGEVTWTADVEGPVALFMAADGIENWTAFMVAPDGWQPAPGLDGPRVFRVRGADDRPLRRRWTGEEADPEAAPPDQYLLGDIPIDVYDDVDVAVDGTARSSPLPWCIH